MNKFKFILGVIGLTLTVFLSVSPPKAVAWSDPNLSDCSLPAFDWAWKASIKTQSETMRVGSPTTYNIPSGGYDFDGWAGGKIMFQGELTSTNFVYIAFVSSGTNAKFRIEKDTALLSPHVAPYHVLARNGGGVSGNMYKLDISAKTVSWYSGISGFSDSKYSNMTCMRGFTGLGVPYATFGTTYDGRTTFSTVYPSESTTSPCNGALDVGCWIARAFTGVSDTFLNVMRAFTSAFVSFWLPDTEAISTSFSDLQTTLSTKLGFLTFPAVFLIDVFNAFNPSTSWCTSTTCSKSFGNFYGAPFTLNFLTLKVVAPSMWDLLIGFVRGITIFSLIVMLRKKFIATVRT